MRERSTSLHNHTTCQRQCDGSAYYRPAIHPGVLDCSEPRYYSDLGKNDFTNEVTVLLSFLWKNIWN